MVSLPTLSLTVQAIDKLQEDNQESPRGHMGASLIGHPCDRWLWLSFRWAVIERFPGRILRLFQRGQREEAVFVGLLRSIGVQIHHTSLDGEQTRVDFGSHVSGSVDGIIEGGLPEAPKTRHIAEFKTHGHKSFSQLQKEGVYTAKRQHWCQMQVYMLGTGIDRAFYMAVNKDTDELYTERVKFDPDAAHQLVERGKRIALSERMPPPVSTNPSFFGCKFCPAYSFCHQKKLTKELNCRTCAHSTPKEDGTWRCEHLNSCILQLEEQRTPCDYHVIHPDLTPWDWSPADKEGHAIRFHINGQDVLNGWGPGTVSSKDLLAGKYKPDPDQPEVPF